MPDNLATVSTTSTIPGGKRVAAYQLVDALARLDVDYIFGLCGHTNIAVLDALRTSPIKWVTARHEQVAAHIADGYARATGKPGVVLLHLGPGLTNAMTGIANAALEFYSVSNYCRGYSQLLSWETCPPGNQPAQ